MKSKKKRRIHITIKSTAKVFDEVLKTWNRAEKGLPVEEAEAELSFTDGATMLSTLSEKRMELLMFLHKYKAMNIKQLAQRLKRDYSNVHGDVKLLLRFGLLEKDEDQQVFVPWDELAIELPLAA
jgi:predicted transcriptional regulator